MAFVTLTNISVLDNPTQFTNPFQFEVTFECVQQLDDDLEWKIIYVGSAENEAYDQVLEEVLVGPVPVGTNKFVFQANPPNLDIVPDEDKVGVTVVLITCSYKEKEFVRVGYYVNVGYGDEEVNDNDQERVNRPVQISKLQRNILADKPRVTRFPIDWTGADATNPSYDDPLMEAGPSNADDENRMMDEDTDLMQAANQLYNDDDDFFVPDGEDLEDDYEEDDEEDDMDMEDSNVVIDLEAP